MQEQKGEAASETDQQRAERMFERARRWAEKNGVTQTARSKLAAMGFKEEPDDGLPGIGIIGGVRKPKPGSRLAALGFKPEQDETDEGGRHGTGIVGGVRRSDQGARSKLSHRFEEWDGPPGIGIIGGVRKPKA